MRKDNDIAIASAMYGIAANLTSLGSIFQKRFGIPIPCEEFSTSNLKINKKKAQMMKNAKNIFAGQVSMMHCHQLSCLNRFFMELMASDDDMRDKLVVLMGEYWQILSVVNIWWERTHIRSNY